MDDKSIEDACQGYKKSYYMPQYWKEGSDLTLNIDALCPTLLLQTQFSLSYFFPWLLSTFSFHFACWSYISSFMFRGKKLNILIVSPFEAENAV
jgi:hypothetical protein